MVFDVEKEHLKAQQDIELHRATKKINPDYYHVLYLMYFEKLNTEDVAMIMNKYKRQIGNLLYRSKRQFFS